jgi:hypothetical protein
MRFAYLYIFKGLIRLFAACTLLWAVAFPLDAVESESPDPAAARNSLEDKSYAPVSAGAADPDALKVGPGSVSFRISPTGRWLSLIPDWTAGKSVVTGGGIVVMAVGKDGDVVELANTAAGDGSGLRGRKETLALRPVHEGIGGGVRYPLARADDDGDGQENEERLDGIDNDGDGRVDEDYAAAGDQMVALSYEALDEDGRPVLDCYQECYTWTLPHIDGMVAMKVVVRNSGERTLEEVRVGTVVYRPEGFSVSTQDLEPATDDRKRLASKGILLSEPGGTAVAAVFFTEAATEGASWLTGVASPRRQLADLVQTFVTTERGAAVDSAPVPDADEESVESKRDANPPTKTENSPSNERMAYGVSPNLGSLAPGDEVVVYLAILAVPSIERIDRAIDDAYRTMIGDGTHRMIPPPVSVTRQTVWGRYDVQPGVDDDAPVNMTITLENARGHGIDADDISYLAGIDLTRVEIKETFDGNLELTISGDVCSDAAERGGRVALHGRLRSGEFFDVVLNPSDAGQRNERLSEVNETQYWSHPGRLDEALLAGSPNPFRESTTIYYEVPSNVSDDTGGILSLINPVQTSVKIYNVAGRLVGVLVDTILSPGQYNTQWAALDDNGNTVASGVYYVKLQIGERHVTKRLIQLK